MNAYGMVESTLKKIPQNMKITLIASFVIGLIGHMFCFTNTLFLHDAAGVYWETVSFADAASGSRWLYPIYDWILNGVQLPWLDGLLTLFIYGIAAWVVCEILSIKQQISVIFVTGFMVLSPTAIASNCYLSSAPIYSMALLFSCMAVYAFYNWNHGCAWLFLFAMLSEGSYAAYIGFTICLFFLRNFNAFIVNTKEQDKKLFKQHWIMLICVIVTMAATFGIMKLLQIGSTAYMQARISAVTESGAKSYLENIYYTIYTVARTFLPGGSISYMQERPVAYVFFLIAMISSCLIYLKMLIGSKIWDRKLGILLLGIDIIALPFAMNILRLITDAHTLMQFGFIVPWILCIQIFDNVSANHEIFKSKKLLRVYSWIIVLFSMISIGNFGILANTVYAKEAVLYETSISLTNRIVERIESTEGYVPGETPVIFVGDTREYYAPYHEGFAICDSITGIGSEWWDTSLTYNFPLMVYIQQHLGIEMNILNDTGAIGMSTHAKSKIYDKRGHTISKEELEEKLDEMGNFPSDDCMMYIEDVLVFKLGD